MKKDLIRQLLKANVQLVSTQSLSEDVCSSLRKLKVDLKIEYDGRRETTTCC